MNLNEAREQNKLKYFPNEKANYYAEASQDSH